MLNYYVDKVIICFGTLIEQTLIRQTLWNVLKVKKEEKKLPTVIAKFISRIFEHVLIIL